MDTKVPSVKVGNINKDLDDHNVPELEVPVVSLDGIIQAALTHMDCPEIYKHYLSDYYPEGEGEVTKEVIDGEREPKQQIVRTLHDLTVALYTHAYVILHCVDQTLKLRTEARDTLSETLEKLDAKYSPRKTKS